MNLNLCGTNGRLFAQIQADSDINENELEGLSLDGVITAISTLVEKFRDNTIIRDYISAPEYLTKRTAIADFINKLYKNIILFEANEKNNMPLFIKSLSDKLLLNSEQVTVLCGIERHALLVNFKLVENRLNITIYNTGSGLDFHNQEVTHEGRKFNLCLQQTLTVKESDKDSKAIYLNKILSTLLNVPSNEKLTLKSIEQFYLNFFSIKLLADDAQLLNSEKRMIIGQRSGSCTWKSNFAFIRHKLLEAGIIKSSDAALFKYDIKLLSMLDMQQLLRSNSSLTPPATLILSDAINFACANNARLIQKINKATPILDNINCKNALKLFKDIKEYSALMHNQALLTATYGNKVWDMITKTKDVNYFITASEPVNMSQQNPATNASSNDIDCITFKSCDEALKALNALSLAVNLKEKNIDINLIIIATLKACKDHLLPSITGERLEDTVAAQLATNIYIICDYYAVNLNKDGKSCYGEERHIPYLLGCAYMLRAIHDTFLHGSENNQDKKSLLAYLIKKLYDSLSYRITSDPALGLEIYNLKNHISLFCDSINISYNQIYNYNEKNSLDNEDGDQYLTCCLRKFPTENNVRTALQYLTLLNNSRLSSKRSYTHEQQPKLFNKTLKKGIDNPLKNIEKITKDLINKNKIIEINQNHYIQMERKYTPTESLIGMSKVSFLGLDSICDIGINIRAGSYRCGNLDDRLLGLFNTSTHTSSIYVPKNTRTTEEDAKENLLKSLFAEYNISMQRINEFIKEKFNNLNDKLYRDIILMRLFSNNSIYEQINRNSDALVTLLETLKSNILDHDHTEELTDRQIFLLHVYYKLAWNAQVITNSLQNQTNKISSSFVKKLSISIKESDKPKEKLNKLLEALIKPSYTKKELDKRALLLKLQLLHFMLIDLTRNLNKKEIEEVLLLALTLCDQINTHKNGLSYVNSEFICNIIKKITIEDAEHIEINSLIAALPAKANNLKLNLKNQTLEFTLNESQCIFNFATGITSGHKNSVSIPEEFLENENFNAIFESFPPFCQAYSKTKISFEYKGHNWIIENKPSFSVYRDKANLIIGPRPIILNDAHRLPLTLVDGTKELYAKSDSEIFIVCKKSKELMYTVSRINYHTSVDIKYTVKRESDGAELLFENENYLYIKEYARFEDPCFIEVWQLTNGLIQILLPRYEINSYQASNGVISVEHKSLPKNYTLLQDDKLTKQFTHALFLMNSNKQQVFIILPQQQYIIKSDALGFKSGRDCILYDIIAAIHIYNPEKNNPLYLNEINSPNINKYSAAAEFIIAEHTDNGIITNDPKTALHLAYYLLGQRNYVLAHNMLMQAKKLRPDFIGCDKELSNIILDFPRYFIEKPSFTQIPNKTERNVSDGQYSVPQIALRLQALSFLISSIKLSTEITDNKEILLANVLQEGRLLTSEYLANIKNIPLQYKLPADDELIVFAHYHTNKHCNSSPNLSNFFKTKQAKLLNHNKVSLQICKDNSSYSIHEQLVNSWPKSSGLIRDHFDYELDLNHLDQMMDIDYVKVINGNSFFALLKFVIDKPKKHDDLIKVNHLLQMILYNFNKEDKDHRLFHTYALLHVINSTSITEKENIKRALDQEMTTTADNRIPSNDFICKHILRKNKRFFPTEATTQTSILFKLNRKISNSTINLPIQSYIKFRALNNLEELFTKYDFQFNAANQQTILPAHNTHQPNYLSRIDDNIYGFLKEQHLQDYNAGLQINRQISKSKLNISMGDIDINTLKRNSQQISEKIVNKFNINLASLEYTIKLAAEQNLSAMNITQILQLFIGESLEIIQDTFGLQPKDCNDIYKLVFEYLFIETYIQRIKRSDYSPRAYNTNDSLTLIANCLLFEYLANSEGVSIYPQQIENIRSIIDKKNSLILMPMGGGKSKVMLPIIAIQNTSESMLSVLIVPEALFSTTMLDISNITHKVYNKLPIVINYERDDLSINSLQKILVQLQSARIKRNYVMMTPETLHTLYLSRKESILKFSTKQQNDLFADIFAEFIKYGICTIDEIDNVLSLQREHNFASVNYQYLQQKFPKSTKLCVNLFRALAKIFIPYAPDFTVLDMVRGHDVRKPSDRKEWRELIENISNYIAGNQQEIFNVFELPFEIIKSAITMGVDINSITGLNPTHKDMLSLIKFQITELLSLTIMTPYREQYGAKNDKDKSLAGMIAIPYCDQMPIIGSEFSDPIATINYTIQYVLHKHTKFTDAHIQSVADRILKNIQLLSTADKEKRLQGYKAIFNVNKLTEKMLSNIEFISITALNSANNINLKFFILEEFILKAIVENDYEQQSNAYTFNNIFTSVCGFSGTLDNLDTFHPNIVFANQQQSLGTNGVVIDTIYSKNTKVITATNADSSEELRLWIKQDIEKDKKLHALIDIGAAFKAVGNNYAIAKIICEALQNNSIGISHVLFFNDNIFSALAINNYEKIINLGTSNLDSICSKLNITGAGNYFTFYDQSHCRGIDVQHVAEAHAIITIGDHTSLSQLLQASMRMRDFKLNSRQSLEIFVSYEAVKVNKVTANWTLDDVMHYVISNTFSMTLDDNLQAAYLLMNNEIQTVVEAIAYTKNIDMPNQKLRQALSKERSSSLLARYGTFTENIPIYKALTLYKHKILDIGKSFNITEHALKEIEEKCNILIHKYVKICRPQASSALNGFKENNLKFITKEQNELSNEKSQSYKHSVKSHLVFTADKDHLPHDWHSFIKYATADVIFKFNQDTFLNKIFGTHEVEENVRMPHNIANFYSKNNSEHMYNIDKHIYYIAELKEHGKTQYLLLNEELKNMLVLRLQPSVSNINKWHIPIGDELYIYTLHNSLEFAATNSVNREPNSAGIPNNIMVMLYTFNADVDYLLKMLDQDDSSSAVFDFFTKNTKHKLDYINQKVNSGRRDQLSFFNDLKNRLLENISLEAESAPCCSRLRRRLF